MLATQSPQGSPARTPADPAPVDVTPLFPRGVYEDIDNCAEVIAAQDDLDQRRRAGAPPLVQIVLGRNNLRAVVNVLVDAAREERRHVDGRRVGRRPRGAALGALGGQHLR